VWTITGPGSSLTLTNTYPGFDPVTGAAVTISRTLQLNAPIGDGQTVTIDTRRGRQRITRSDGVNMMPFLTTDPALWPLADGVVNTITATLGAAGANSRIAGTYEPLYAGV
jgi:hypothetical protein